MSDQNLVTIEQVKDLLKTEGITPEEVFDAEALKPIRDAARQDGYVEGVMSAGFRGKPTEGETKPAEPDPAKYIDPKTNPFIKTD